MKKLALFLIFITVSLVVYQYFLKAPDFPSLPYLPDTTNQSYNTKLKVGDIELMVEVVDTVE